MNADNLTQMLQQGLRVTLGAASSLAEVLQNPQKREENLEKIQTQLGQLTEEWAQKGAVTEQEARSFVDNLIAQTAQTQNPGSEYSTTSTITTTATATPDSGSAQEIQELTDQISSLREELERLRNSESN
ncbi:MAG: hypothetical protein ACFBSC_20685 [Microcoleaceae cyanobacterium]